MKPPVRHETAVGDEAMEVRMEVDQITEGLDRDDGSGYAFRPVQGRAEKLLIVNIETRRLAMRLQHCHYLFVAVFR